jgi:fluoroquinolone transport system permease protein
MKKIFNLAVNDFRHVFRDRMLCIFLLAPIALICFVRFFVPYIAGIYPVINDYSVYIMMFAGIQTSIMFGFITAFIILEEKDENLLQVIRILPVSTVYFIVYRLLFATCFSTLSAFLMLYFGNLAWPGLANSLLLALHYGLAAPFITLLIATYAKNKIEGLAFFKGIDLVILIPIVGFFFPEGWKYVMSFIPVFWTYDLYSSSLEGGRTGIPFIIGLLFYLAIFVILIREFRKKVFRTA